MKIFAVQMDVVPGRPDLNFKTIQKYIVEAKAQKADLAVFPEMCIPGYLISDLWEETTFVLECLSINDQVTALADGIDILFGSVARENVNGENGRPLLYNAAYYASQGNLQPLVQFQDHVKYFLPKTLLPCYREFDEPRYFSDLRALAVKWGTTLENILKPYRLPGGIQLGITICEDGWDANAYAHPFDILGLQMSPRDLFVNISCSPYTLGKTKARNRVFSHHAKQHGIPLLYLNSVGTQNNGKNIYAFEGDSCVYGSKGDTLFSFPTFEPYATTLTVDDSVHCPIPSFEKLTGMAEVRVALVYMIRENLKRWGIRRVVIGASGGIDSAVSAVLYSDALGAENVFLVNMPTRFNSDTTKNAARDLADNLGCPYMVAPITEVIESLRLSLAKDSFVRNDTKMIVEGIHYENVQARMRSGAFLATIASVVGGAFTCNGNKSEIFVGYCTLYGDTSGVLCALGDLWKVQVYELAREINKQGEIIPQKSIDIPASAELSEAQNVDEGKGDPIIYPYHDKLFSYWLERWNRNGLSDSIHALKTGTLCSEINFSESRFREIFPDDSLAVLDMELWWKRYKGIALAKRIQMPPILSVSRRAFGFDYRESQMGR